MRLRVPVKRLKLSSLLCFTIKFTTSAEHRMYAQMNRLTEAGAMISLAIELITSNIRRNYGEINFERYPRPVEVEGEDKH